MPGMKIPNLQTQSLIGCAGGEGLTVTSPDIILDGIVHIRFKLKDGTETSMLLDDYIFFMITNAGKSPKECTKKEFEEKTFAMRL